MDDLASELSDLDLESLGLVEYLESVRGFIVPEARRRLQEQRLDAARGYARSNEEVIKDVEAQKQLMIAVSTGGPRIQSVNAEYVERRERLIYDLGEREIPDPNPYSDLWQWYGKWSADIPGYQPRREYVASIYAGLLQVLRTAAAVPDAPPTGWERVDRGRIKMGAALARATHEEDHQTVGLLAREALISLAQAVYRPEEHAGGLDVLPSPTDAARMLEGFLNAELAGASNETLRRYGKASLALANELVHKRTATFRDAALAVEATKALIEVVAIVSGRRGQRE